MSLPWFVIETHDSKLSSIKISCFFAILCSCDIGLSLWAYVYVCACVSECVRVCVCACVSVCESVKKSEGIFFFFSDEGTKERNDFGRQFIPFKCGSPLWICSIQSRTFGKMWSKLFKITILAEFVLVPLWFSTFWVILRVFTMIIQWNRTRLYRTRLYRTRLYRTRL